MRRLAWSFVAGIAHGATLAFGLYLGAKGTLWALARVVPERGKG